MELSGVELSFLVNKIKAQVIAGYYVSSVIPVTRNSFLFKLHHTTEPDIMLMISTMGIWITKLKFKTLEHNDLGEIIKSNLERSKIETITQPGSERIAILYFRRPGQCIRIVVVEIFAEGNIILCDEKMCILAILKPIGVKHRTLRVGSIYKPPPSRGLDLFDLSFDEFARSGKNAELLTLPIAKWVGRVTSLPRKYVEEVMARSNIRAKTVGDLTGEDITRIYSNTKSVVEEITNSSKHNPVIVLDENGNPTEALPLRIDALSTAIHNRHVPEYMEAVDQVLSHKLINVGNKIKTGHIDKRVDALLHDIAEQEKAKAAVTSKARAIRKIAGELMSMPYEGPDIMTHSSIRKLIEEKLVKVFSYKGTRFLEVAGENVELHQSSARMASMLFQRAKDMERGLSSIEQSKTKLMERINKLKNEASSIEAKANTIQHVRNREWYERYRWFTTSDGLLAIGGRDASSNSAIIRKHLDEQDIVFHAEIHGSPFFVLKNPNLVENIDKSLLEVAEATVSFSRAWKDSLSSGDAYWVMATQVKRGAPTGQFVPKGSFVIEGKRSYIKGIQIHLTIGIVEQQGAFYLCCGPSRAIRNRSLIYADLLPGALDPMIVAKKLRSEFLSLVHGDNSQLAQSLSMFIQSANADEYIRSLPHGQSKISGIHRTGSRYASQNDRNNESNEQSN
jgi:predicted ribosome quality control (RQC) complex YloA/Tae2 family protein